MEGISVVIPNYNGLELLPYTLPTVFAALKTQPLPYELIVCDDGSSDDSVAFIQKTFPDIKLILQTSNNGFSVTANLAVSSAIYDWVLLLNSDVKLEQNYFMPLFQYIETDKCFGVMGRIIGWDDEIIQDGAKFPRMQGMKIKTSGNYLLEDMSNAGGLPTAYLSGANMFIRKKIFKEIGQLNELFSPFYVEDYELSLRAWRLGYSCFYEHKAVCRHKTSHSIKKNREKSFVNKIYNRNKMFLHAIHLDGFDLSLWYGQLIFECIARTVAGQFYFARAFEDFLRNSWEIKRSRRKLSAASKGKTLRSVKEVMREIKDFARDKKIIRF
jgi:GT2 family glycosyltransferase